MTTALLNLLLTAMFGSIALLECRRLLRRHRDLTVESTLEKAPYLHVLIPLLALLLIANAGLLALRLKRPSLLWAMPLWLDYHINAINWGAILSLFAFTFGLGSAVAVHTGHREKGKIVAASLLLVGTIPVLQWNCTRPVAHKLGDEINAAGMVSQTSDVSCAAASGATILRTFGVRKTERETAAVFGTSVLLGTSAAEIVYGLERLGFTARKIEVPDADPERATPPAMLFVDHPVAGPESHAVAYLGFREGKAQIWDPLMGLLSIDKQGVSRIWRGRGIEVRPAVR